MLTDAEIVEGLVLALRKDDCFHNFAPGLRLVKEWLAEARAEEAARWRAEVEAIVAAPDDEQWWPVRPYTDPASDDEAVEVQVVNADRLRALVARMAGDCGVAHSPSGALCHNEPGHHGNHVAWAHYPGQVVSWERQAGEQHG